MVNKKSEAALLKKYVLMVEGIILILAYATNVKGTILKPGLLECLSR